MVRVRVVGLEFGLSVLLEFGLLPNLRCQAGPQMMLAALH